MRVQALALVALVLAGCGHGSSLATASAPLRAQARAASAIFPTDVGHAWQYQVVAHPQDDLETSLPGTDTLVIDTARKTARGGSVTLKELDSFTEYYRFPVVSFDDSKLVIAGVSYFGAGASAADDLAIDFLHFPLVAGSQWDDGQCSSRLASREQVTVPAGTFDAWKVSSIGTYDNDYTAVGDYWFAPGVGIVKSHLTIPNYYVDSELVPAGAKLPKGQRLALGAKARR